MANGVHPMIESIYGNLPKGWSLVSIADLIEQNQADLQTGPFGTMLHASAYKPNGTPVVAVKNIADNRLDHTDIPHIDATTVNRLSRYQLITGDILFGRKGAVERRALVRTNETGWVQGSDCIRLRFLTPEIDALFVSYVLGSPQYRSWIIRNAHGATMPSLNQDIIGRIPLPLPPLPEQHAIARILGALDDKIELNRRMNATLEAMAQAIFRSWFVDFDPVRAMAEGRQPEGMDEETAALFPDAFETVDGREVPEGWGLMPLSEVCEKIFSGGTPNTKNSDYWNGDIPWLSSGETRNRYITATEKTITQLGVSNSSTRFVRSGATVIASAGQGHTRGQTSLLAIDCYINQSVVAVIADSKQISDLYLFFDLSRRYNEFRQISDSHSSRGSLTTKALAHLDLVVPSPDLVSKFSQVVKPIIEKGIMNLEESRTLAAIRDTLLPKLISGEIRVNIEETLHGS